MKSLGDRIKQNYENRSRNFLTRRTPVIMRLDGKTFHTLTRSCEKPFDSHLKSSMVQTAFFLCSTIQGAKCAYQQSDEISILITDFDKLDTDAWFDYNIQKMTSISAAFASVKFTELFGKVGYFDSRVFNIPIEEVCNYFIWRQMDWQRNSIQMLARAHYSHRELNNKNTSDIHEMLHEKDLNWAKLDSHDKDGVYIYKDESWELELNTPIFKTHREVIENLLVI